MAVQVPGFLEVNQLIELAKKQGCEQKIAKFQIVTPEGIKGTSNNHAFPIFPLRNPLIYNSPISEKWY